MREKLRTRLQAALYDLMKHTHEDDEEAHAAKHLLLKTIDRYDRAIPLLRAMVADDPSSCDNDGERDVCRYCFAMIQFDEPHQPDCSYLLTQTLLAEIDSPSVAG